MEKSNFKKLLATASAFAVITGAATGASATTWTTNAANATVNNGNAVANMSAAGNFADGDHVTFGGAHDVTVGTAATTIGTVDANGNAGATLVINGATTIGSVTDSGGANVVGTTVNDDKTLTLTGTTFDGLGDIELGSADTNAATLVINGDMTLKGTINSDGAGNLGILTVNTGKTAVFEGIIGATHDLAKINLDGTSNSTFKAEVTSTAISLNGGTAAFDGAVNAATTSTAQGGTLTLAGLHTGNLNLELGTTVVNAAAITGDVTLGDNATVVATGTITGDVTSPAAATGGSITGVALAGDLDLTNGGTAVFTGNITAGGANGHVTLGSTAKATLSGTVAGNVTTTGSALVLGNTATTNVTGNVSINTSNTTTNTLGDVTGTTALVAGALTMGNGTGAVTVTDGTLNMGNATAAVTVNGGTVETLGTVGGNLITANAAVVETVGRITGNAAASGTSTINATDNVVGTLGVTGSALFTGSALATDVTGATTINTDSDGTNTLHDAAAVTVTKGNLTMNDATGNVVLTAGNLIMNDATGGTVTVTAGNLTMNNATGGTVTVNGGTVVINDVTGANNAVTLNAGTSTINSIGDNLVMTATAAATVVGDITGNTTTAATNTLTLSGAGTNTGAITNLGKIVVQGERKFSAITTPGTIALEGSGAKLTVGASLGAAVVTSDDTHDITATAAQTLTGSIGTAANPINLIMDGDNAANMNTANFHGNVTTTADSKASLVFGAAVDATVASAGTASKKLKVATFTESGTVTDGFYVDDTTVAAGKTATIGGTVAGTTFELADDPATRVNFLNDATVDVAIDSAAANSNGIVEFKGNVALSSAIGAANGVGSVIFSNTAGKEAAVGANITAANIELGKGTVRLTSDATFSGATGVTAGTLDLASKTLTQDAATTMTISGSTTIKSTLTADSTVSAISGGKLTIAGTLNGAADTAITLELDDSAVVRKHGGGRTYTLISSTANAAANFTAADIVAIKATNKLLSYTAAVDANGQTILTEVDNAKTYLAAIHGGKYKNLTDAFADGADGTDLASMTSLLGSLETSGNSTKSEEALQRIKEGSVVAASAVTDNMSAIGNTLGDRAMALNAPKVTGVGAGDDATRFGAWVSPFYGRVNQSARNSVAGFKSESYGIALGLDTKVNEDLTLGVAITASNANIKHKDLKSGDRTKVNSLLFSIYNMQNITDNWFVSGSATFGTNDVNNTAKRVSSATAYEQASAKYSVTSFNLNQVLGYNYAVEQAVVTPMIGLKYSRVNDASYSESGTSYQNLDVATKAFDKLELVAGAKVAASAYDMGGLSLTPEAHAFVNYNMFNNGQKQSVSLNGKKLASSSDKAVRANYNVGLGVSSEYGAMEYGASYDFQFANKKTGHQGSLKVRMNF